MSRLATIQTLSLMLWAMGALAVGCAVESRGTGTDAGPIDAGPPPALPEIDGVDYPVIALGGTLTARGSDLSDVSRVRIGGRDQPFEAVSDTVLVVGPVNAAVGSRRLVAFADGLGSEPFSLMVVRLAISEVDEHTDEGDATRFVELSTGLPGVSLAGYGLAFYEGVTMRVAGVLQLESAPPDSFLLLVGGGALEATRHVPLPSGFLGADDGGSAAIALYQGAELTVGDAVSGEGLLDAVVLSRNGLDDPELLALLPEGPSRAATNESVHGQPRRESAQRCGQRRLDARAFVVAPPTPGFGNTCP